MMTGTLRPFSHFILRAAVARSSNSSTEVSRYQASWCRRRHTHIRRFSTGINSTTLLGETEPSEELNISESCVKQLKKVREEEPGLLLRVMVDGGGCSGFQYKIDFDKRLNPDDKVFKRDGVSVVVDELSLGLLGGCTVDYHTELIRAGFRITGNPNAENCCSCGVSFAPK